MINEKEDYPPFNRTSQFVRENKNEFLYKKPIYKNYTKLFENLIKRKFSIKNCSIR